MPTENPYRPGPPRSQGAVRPPLLIQLLRPLYVAVATVALVLLTAAVYLMTWASGSGTVSDMPYISASVNGFGRAVSQGAESHSSFRFVHLLVALLVLVLLVVGAALIAATDAQRLGALVVCAAGTVGVLKGLVAVITGMGRKDGFGIIGTDRFDSYFWHIDYTSSLGAGPFLAVLLGLVAVVVGLLYLGFGARGPLVPYPWLVRLRGRR
jgi:hypothetical protein